MTLAQLTDHINQLVLTTERLTLRKMDERDFDIGVEHELNPEIMRYIRDVKSREQTEAKVKEIITPWQAEDEKWCAFSVVLTATDQVIGMVCFNFQSLEFMRLELGYRFDPKFHGQGYAFEAAKAMRDHLFEQVKIHKMVAYCVAEHAKSYLLMEKLGMKREACLREHSQLQGKWHDELIYGLLDSEYQAMRMDSLSCQF